MEKKTPSSVTRIPYPESVGEGSGFALSDGLFNAWWAALTPEDRDEFSYVYGGSASQARFVCALDYFKVHSGRASTDDLIVRAYALAGALNYDDARKDFVTRSAAQATYEHPAVERLLEMLRYRSRRIAEERIHNRVASAIEKIFERADGLDPIVDFDNVTKLEQLALAQGNMFLARASKERAAHENRKAQESSRAAITIGRAREVDALRPPSSEQARSYVMMLREALGPEEFAKIVAEPLALSGE